MLEALKAKGFQITTHHHAEAILMHDMQGAVEELEWTLLDLSIPIEKLVRGGGGKHEITQWMEGRLSKQRQWVKHNFEIRRTIDGDIKELISHEVDHVKTFDGGTIALEIEWNTKDSSFDRDLDNFRRLQVEGVISVGCVITRGTSLQDGLREKIYEFAVARSLSDLDKMAEYYNPTKRQKEMIEKKAERIGSFEQAWAHSFFADKFSESSTHWRKLEARVRRGLGSPCPLLLIGIPISVIEL
jgi:hypothetical protein